MTWAPEPQGVFPFATWQCMICRMAGITSAVQNFDKVREQAVAHIAETGHDVGVVRGRSEVIHAVSAEPVCPREPGCTNCRQCRPAGGPEEGK